MKRFISRFLVFALFFTFQFPAFAADYAENRDNTVNELLSQLTLEKKIAQMIMPDFTTWNGSPVTACNGEIAKIIQDYGFGGVILFGANTPGTAQTAELVYDLQAASDIPMLISIDQEGGYITRLGTGTTTAGNMALGATRDPALAEETGMIIGSELCALGINVDFAPDMDVNNNPANPIIGVRSFSDDPALTAQLGTAYLHGLQGENVSAALKHFPGHGDTATDSHTGLPCINKTLSELEQCELIPFQAGIDAGTDLIMTAHIQYPLIDGTTYTSKLDGKKITLPATLSKVMITDILRGKMGYNGVVCTDAMRMDAIAKHFDSMDAARLAINAGVDILLVPVVMNKASDAAKIQTYIQGIADMVRNGKIREAQIDHAVTRILSLKEKRGLLNRTALTKQQQVSYALSVVGSEANHTAEWEICRRAVTMVKNEDMLPVRSDAQNQLLLFCSYGNEVNSMEYAMEKLRQEGKLAANASWKIVCYQNKTVLSAEDRAALASATAVIASVESYRAANLTGGWQASFLDDLIQRTHDGGKQIAIISLQLPYDLARYQKADALLAVYGSQGMDTIPTVYNGETKTFGLNLPAAVYIALGGSEITGRLPVDIPKLDASYAYTDSVLYARGFGLDYPDEPVKPAFVDVPETSYYYDAVCWAVERGITKGTTETTFSPMQTCTRAHAVTMLYRMAGEPEVSSTAAFTDIRHGSFYETAVAWASENEIVLGYGDGRFGPDDTLTREQLVTILYRYAAYTGAELPDCEAVDLYDFFDAPQVSRWATQAMKWAVYEGIIVGDRQHLMPKQHANRAQLVTILYRFEQKTLG